MEGLDLAKMFQASNFEVGEDGAAPALDSMEKLAVTEEDGGDLLFWITAVTRNSKPNSRGLIFAWDSPSDVGVKQWRENPVLLFMHDKEKFPVGRIERIQVTMDKVRALCRVPAFPELETLRRYIRQNYIRAVSAGLFVKKAEKVVPKRPPGVGEEAQWQLRMRDTFFKIKAFEMAEASICTIGAHQGAIIERGTITTAKGRMARDKKQDGSPFVALDAVGLHEGDFTWDEETSDTEVMLTLNVTNADHATPTTAWQPISLSGTSQAAHDDAALGLTEAWDQSAEVAEATTDQLAVMAALADPEHLDAKRGYQLIHHHASGVVNWIGLRVAAARLMGARGGIEGLTATARKGAAEHLSAHYAQFGIVLSALRLTEPLSNERLKFLHEAGLILIPGVLPGGDDTETPEPTAADDAREGVRALIEAIIDDRLASSEASFSARWRVEAQACGVTLELSGTPDSGEAGAPGDEGQPSSLPELLAVADEESVARIAQAVLSDPALVTAREAAATRAVEALKVKRTPK